jgi:signal transduction histidine kinase/DNA-binding response OmpR family regulator
MNKHTIEIDFYRHESRVKAAKEISYFRLSKVELIKQYSMMVKGYEALIREVKNQTRTGTPPGISDFPADQPEEIREIKSRLLSHVTHEFLTPLNLIITPIEQMLPQCQDQDQKKMLSMVYRNSQRLLLVVNQVLELLKLESRNFKLKARRYNLITFLKGIMANFELLAQQKEVELIFNIHRDNIPLYFDQEKLAEVICNLVMNSLRHTPPGGRISLSVRELPDKPVEISLQNTGAEIPPDHTSHIFDRFYQLTERFEQYIKGLGIGLFLAREYIELHHGTIRVNSGAGTGTEFIIHLPTGKGHLRPDEILESPDSLDSLEIDPVGCKISQRYAYMLELEKEEQEKDREQQGTLPAVETDELKQDVVLVVEDCTDMRGFIKTILTEAGFMVVEADNGRQGIEVARQIVPDIIISDIMMPEKTGYQLCRELKTDIGTSHIPIILLSVKFQDDEIIKGLECGADDYITKPFNLEILLTRVKNLINQRRRLQQKIQSETVMPSAELDLSSLDNQFIKSIRDTIEENLSDLEFSLDEMADALCMSRTTLYRKLMSLTGQPPKKFIQAYRLKRSLELLKSNFGNVTEVAFKVGFSNSAYFTKCFKEAFNRLPSDFTVS